LDRRALLFVKPSLSDATLSDSAVTTIDYELGVHQWDTGTKLKSSPRWVLLQSDSNPREGGAPVKDPNNGRLISRNRW
jgi:hypothetical protein